MNFNVKGRNLNLTDSLTSYAETKIGRLGRHLADGARCEVELSVEKNPSIANNQVAEVTIYTKGPVIRAREASPDMRSSIDLVAEKLERQVLKYRQKLIARSQGAHRELTNQGFIMVERAEAEAEEAEAGPTIVKSKQFLVKPLTPEEAALQMELVGHDFYVFTNSETQHTAVVYKRRDGNYGLIEPQR